MKVQDLRPSAGPHLGKVMKPKLNILKALQPKVGLLAQLAAHHTEKEEGEEKVEDKPEEGQQWEEEEELQQIEEIIPIESSLYLGSSLASSMDSEQLSEKVEEPSPALEAQRASEWSSADTCQAWDTEDSSYTSELETLSEDAGKKDLPIPEEMGVDTAAAPSVLKKWSSFFNKIPNAVSRMHSLLSSCLLHHRKLWKVSPEIIPPC
ncbi:PREDICTED: uncharacterized protein LOC109316499 [Crocodylus porosus]|uniref:uncharacterized protein LOC109316499 n=1 Tax=Crocodylus porosus TaxID=8502 RepID=UPI00093D96D8|nr:PREDICTED: uncharacterized protein LOC109316499 [Crocodylus porosus]